MKKKIMNEQLAISSLSPLRARFYDYQHFTYPWHFHSEYEIIYISESTGTRFIGNSAEKYNAGDVLLIGSNLPHYLKSDEIYHAGNSLLRVKGTIIQFEKEFMQHSINYYPQFIRIKNLLEESKYGILFPAGCSESMIGLISEIPTENGMNQLILFLKLLKVMSEIPDKRVISTPDFEYNMGKGASRIDKIISFVNQHYTRPVPLEEISAFASMNSTAFCRFFKTETGKSFKNYIFDMRAGYACKLLLMNKMSISQISTECGFETISHFNKVFKKVVGHTPSEYRKIMLDV
ncbi:MAG: AraC family transcriptional regulator [Paludibacter sp.]